MYPPSGREGFTIEPVHALGGKDAFKDAVRAGFNGDENEWSIVSSKLTGLLFFAPVGLTPINCLIPDGSELNRILYNRIFSVLGTSFGEGDGVTTFNLPDYRFLIKTEKVKTTDNGIAKGVLLNPNKYHTPGKKNKTIIENDSLKLNVLIRY